ncbi:hypothetical protein IC229_05660 [Spirosoma sp. BT702]|uniref:Uncharacterized protein n=1 Tax=Spirosoma profusum TaxID=2771354 RepID=A0A926XUY4_9BACT|nr:hypothetical protein [Spirosoma profusum]MBD2700111.1 hypothetical protein [Spirosoma profusum]
MQTLFEETHSTLSELYGGLNMLDTNHKQYLKRLVETVGTNLRKIGESPAETAQAVDTTPTAPPFLERIVLHNIDFWEIYPSQIGIVIGKGIDRPAKNDFELGADTFELTLRKVEITLFCQSQLDSIIGIGLRTGVNREAIEAHAIKLWQKIMLAKTEVYIQATYSDYFDFIGKVKKQIDARFATEVDGVQIFEIVEAA